MADPTKRTFFQRMSKARQHRKAQWYGSYEDFAPDLPAIAKKADYESLAAFHDANPERPGSDITVGSVDEASVHWTISWLSATNEVIARAGAWLDANQTAELPDLVLVLGTADTEQAANHATAQSDTLDTLRDRLYN